MTRSDLEQDPWRAISTLLEKNKTSEKFEKTGPLSTQHVLIAGGDKGIGVHITESLAALGAKISILSEDATSVASMRDRIRASFNVDAQEYVTSFTDPEQTRQAIEWATNLLGPPRCLINAIDQPCTAPFEETPTADMQTVLDINLGGPVNTIRETLSKFHENGSGLVINMASAVALTGEANQAVYAASKAGLVALGQSLHKELSAKSISVFTLCPGVILTEDLEKALGVIATQQNIPYEDLVKQVATANNQSHLLSPTRITNVVTNILTGALDYSNNRTISVFGE